MLAYIDLFSHFLPLAGGAMRRHRLKGPILVFFIVVLSSGIVEITTFVLSRNGIRNLWLIQLYHLLNVILILIVLTAWQEVGIVRTVQRIAISAYALMWVIAKFTFEPLTDADQFTHTAASILILCSVIITLFQFARDKEFHFLNDSRFWIAGGVLMYFAGNVILFSAFGRFILLPSVDAVLIWNVHWGISILVNVMYTVGFLKMRD